MLPLLDRPLSRPLPLSSLPLRTAEPPAPEVTTVGALEAAGDLRVVACEPDVTTRRGLPRHRRGRSLS